MVSVTADPRPVGDGSDDPWPHFRRLALDDPGVAERLRTRSTQTNEVGRCATTLLALGDLTGPIGLVEVGASAGLNLLLDRYRYRYRLGDGSVHELGTGPVVLDCDIRGGEPPLPNRMPEIRRRIGIDLSPVPLVDDAQTRWLIACQWPDQPERIARLRGALTLGRTDPPTVLTGDAVTQVGRLVDDLPGDLLPVVVSTWVMAYLTADQQRDLLSALAGRGARRDLSFVITEEPDQVPGVPMPAARPDAGAGRGRGSASVLVRIDWRDGRRRVVRLAEQHPHGSWVRWDR